MTRGAHVTMALDSVSILHRLAPDVTRRLVAWPDVTALTIHDLLLGASSLYQHGATDKDVNIFLRRTCAQIVDHLGAFAGGRTPDGRCGVFRTRAEAFEPVYPDGLRIASYTGPRRVDLERPTPDLISNLRRRPGPRANGHRP